MRQLGRAALGRIQDVYDYYISPYQFALGIQNFLVIIPKWRNVPPPSSRMGLRPPVTLWMVFRAYFDVVRVANFVKLTSRLKI